MAGAAEDTLNPLDPNYQAVQNRDRWLPGPILPRLNEGVDVWRIDLSLPEDVSRCVGDLLSEAEIDRAHRFHFYEHRQKFILAHGGLRQILASYLDADAACLAFDNNAFGKPALSKEFAHSGLSFNLSHSQDIALLAVASKRDIGIDIEYMRPDLADEQIARRFFSRLEVESFLSLPAQQRKEAFFSCWTRKEAYIKAHGEGLSMPLDQFDVSISPGEPARLLNTRPDPAQALQWRLYALKPDPAYCAALAVRGEIPVLNRWLWCIKPCN